MAEVTITPEKFLQAGLDATYTALSVSDVYLAVNNGDLILHVKNGGASALVVTVVTPGSVASLSVTDQTVTVPIGEERFIGPFLPSAFNRPTDNKIQVQIDQDDTITMAVLRQP